MTEPDVTADASDWELIVEARARRARIDLAILADHPESRRVCAAAAAALDVVDAVLHQSMSPWRRIVV